MNSQRPPEDIDLLIYQTVKIWELNPGLTVAEVMEAGSKQTGVHLCSNDYYNFRNRDEKFKQLTDDRKSKKETRLKHSTVDLYSKLESICLKMAQTANGEMITFDEYKWAWKVTTLKKAPDEMKQASEFIIEQWKNPANRAMNGLQIGAGTNLLRMFHPAAKNVTEVVGTGKDGAIKHEVMQVETLIPVAALPPEMAARVAKANQN